jgi:hypothetical protein
MLTVRGIVPTIRAIERVERPSAASKMIRARKTSRCSVVGARSQASSTARSSGVSRTSAALGTASLCSPIFNFRFGVPQTGSTYDGDRFVGCCARGVAAARPSISASVSS